jgi:plastocyanin
MARRVWATVAAVAMGAVALAGCGSDGGSSSYVEPKGPPVKTFEIVGTSYAFTPKNLTGPAGILEFRLTSKDIQHSLRIKGVDGFLIEAGSGKTASGKVKLEAGKYTFYCDIPGHESQGMVGTLTVE